MRGRRPETGAILRREAFARDSKLLVNLEEVIAHRVFGDVQFLGSLPVAEAFERVLRHLPLVVRQPLSLRGKVF